MIAKKMATTKFSKLKSVVPVKPENAGHTWQGIPHHTLLTAVEDQLADAFGLKTVDRRIILWYHDQRMSAAVRVAKDGEENDTTELWFGVDASNGGDKVIQFYAGGVHADTPMVMDRWSGSRYTFSFSLPDEVARAATIWWESAKEFRHVVATMKRLAIPNYEEVLIQMGRKAIVPWTKIAQADRVWAGGGQSTAWDFQEAVGRALWLTSGPKQMKNLHAATKLMSTYWKFM